MRYTPRVFYAGLAAVAAALLLLGQGLTLAHWSDQVSITGSMTMGHLEWDIMDYKVGPNTDTSMRFSISLRGNGDGEDTGLIDVSLEDAYPGGYGVAILLVKNDGTIPVRIKLWVEAGDCGDSNDMLEFIVVNPAFDAPAYTGEGNVNDYVRLDASAVEDVWDDDWTMNVDEWVAAHGTVDSAIGITDIVGNGLLKLPDSSSTSIEYDDDGVLEPGEVAVIFIWVGISEDMQEREDLMGASCRPAFYIHYLAVQAVP